jgi:predicted acetyltransferase
MIVSNSHPYRKEITYLLSQSMIQMSSAQIQAWMKTIYDPDNMFCMIQDDRVAACIQVRHSVLVYQGKKAAACQILLAAVHPDYRRRKYFSQLLDVVLEQAQYNELFTICCTDFPKLFTNRGFQPVSHTRTCWTSLEGFSKGEPDNVVPYTEAIDLYPFYAKFMSYFDGSILYDRQTLQRILSYYTLNNHKIVVLMDRQDKVRGYAIYRHAESTIHIEILMYLNSNALYDLLHYLSKKTRSVSFVITDQERLEHIVNVDYPREKSTILARINDPKLFTRWVNKKTNNAQMAYERLKRPDWNHL